MKKPHEKSKITLLSRVLRTVSEQRSQWKEEFSPGRTETRHADDESHEERLRMLLDATAETALLIKLDGTILSLNQTAARHLNDDVENLIGKNIYNCMPLVRAAIRKRRTQKLIETKTSMTFDDLSAGRNRRYTLYPIVDQNGRVNQIAIYGQDITALKEHEQRIAFMAHHDALTHLPNRLLFYDRLSQAIHNAHRNRQNTALLYIDLDNFKPVNDQYGHDTGDILLQQVSQRLKLCIRESDTLARLGGDEFAIILPNINHSDAARLVSEKIIASIAEPFKMMHHIIHIGCSIGIAYYPNDAIDQENLVKQADNAMYQAKKQRNTYHFASAAR